MIALNQWKAGKCCFFRSIYNKLWTLAAIHRGIGTFKFCGMTSSCSFRIIPTETWSGNENTFWFTDKHGVKSKQKVESLEKLKIPVRIEVIFGNHLWSTNLNFLIQMGKFNSIYHFLKYEQHFLSRTKQWLSGCWAVILLCKSLFLTVGEYWNIRNKTEFFAHTCAVGTSWVGVEATIHVGCYWAGTATSHHIHVLPSNTAWRKNKNMKHEYVLLNWVDNKGWTKLSLYKWVLVHFNWNFQFIRRCKSCPDFDIHLYYSIFVKMG